MRRRPSTGSCWIACVAGLSGVSTSTAQQVSVVGETPNNIRLTWTVTNEGDKPVSSLEFPLYGVVTHEPPPEGWVVRNFDSLKKGTWIVESKDRPADLRSGRSLSFSCIIGKQGTPLRRGTVVVGFRDGTKTQVGDVLLPVPQSFFAVFGLPAFLALLLVLFAFWKMRGAKRPASP